MAAGPVDRVSARETRAAPRLDGAALSVLPGALARRGRGPPRRVRVPRIERPAYRQQDGPPSRGRTVPVARISRSSARCTDEWIDGVPMTFFRTMEQESWFWAVR